MTPNLKQAVPFFNVTNIEASVHFYVDGLGFAMTKSWTPEGKLRWCWLERDGVALMLQEYLPAYLPTETLGVGVSVCFISADAIALYHEYKARGIAASRPFVGNGMWVTSVIDPDGYRLEFESYTDALEETEYVEDRC
ncbi:MAG TPA: VOC family protein [Blastocatellia bacterium]|nr:VOC family protein [Blastocatellia bacterium]